MAGNFGENLTVEGLADNEVCIGDRFRIGGAVVVVSQPRDTCYRGGIRLNHPEIAALLVAHHRPGFYLKKSGLNLTDGVCWPQRRTPP